MQPVEVLLLGVFGKVNTNIPCIEKPVPFLHIQSSNHRATQISSSPPPPPEAPGAAWAITYSLFFPSFFFPCFAAEVRFSRDPGEREAQQAATCVGEDLPPLEGSHPAAKEVLKETPMRKDQGVPYKVS